jgi:hypothetical protein
MNQLQPTPPTQAPAPNSPRIAEELRQLARQLADLQHAAANLLCTAGYAERPTITEWMIQGATATYHCGCAANALRQCAALIDPNPQTGEILPPQKADNSL